jgi:2-polyprenyl-3-methyl-5-hydroxy-6-metoxy-1,4-benzoquinol methylase
VKFLDRKLRDIRISKARAFLRPGDRLLDIGCFDRTLLDLAAPMVKKAVGIDPLAEPFRDGKIETHQGTIPGEHPFKEGEFDCITMLAVLEHIVDKESLAKECFRLLAPGGRVIITVPHPFVDTILAGLTRMRLIEGMSLEEHHGYDVRQTPGIFAKAGFRLGRAESFELGLNKLFLMEKPRTWPARVEVKPMVPAGTAPGVATESR